MWNTIARVKIRQLTFFVQDLLGLRFHTSFNDMPEIAGTLGSEKPTWAKFLEFEFFFSLK